MNSLSDQELLREYAGHQSEAAFAELVRRHLDLVYSAALRMVRDSSLAEDVAQGVFLALAQNASQLAEHPVLVGWLHRTTQNLASKVVRSEVRRRAREQEVAVMNELFSAEPDATWEQIAPQLDDALGELSELDRDALLLRYFQRRSAREIGQTLGLSDEAAQKRVSRAVERLREILARRGVTVAASGLVAVLSVKAVHAAPPGLFATIASTATAATITATKALIMTTFQKTVLAAVIVTAVGTGIYEANRVSKLRGEVETSQQRLITSGSSNVAALAALQGRLDSLTGSNADLASALAQVNAENAGLHAEREQARHSAAVFKELASQANSKDRNLTNDFPTVRHLMAGMGKVLLHAARLNGDESKLSPEEKSTKQAARVDVINEFSTLIKAAQQLGLDLDSDPFGNDRPDGIACLLLGALDLNKQQFSQIYGVLQKYEQQAKQQGLLDSNPPPESETALKSLSDQARLEIRGLLTSEQASKFDAIGPQFQPVGAETKLDLKL